jgi:hypothetical protein
MHSPVIRTSDPIEEALAARYPLVYLHSAEEDRVMRRLEHLAEERLAGAPVHHWTCTRGFDGSLDGTDTRDPAAAIAAVMRHGGPGLFVLKDLSAFMDRADVVRALRDAYYALSGKERTVLFILSPALVVPPTLEKNLGIVRVPPPDLAELEDAARGLLSDRLDKPPPPEWLRDLALTLKGLTIDEARHLLFRALAGGRLNRRELLDALTAAKKDAVLGSALDYVPHRVDLHSVGGLSALKDWIIKRAAVFDTRASEAGLPTPRGMLLMGISGCGKSLCAKLVAGTWRVPLFRLDMNAIYAGLAGNPEAAFRRALETVESVAPAVLWIDEIENGLGMTAEQGQSASRIFASFLTWMQEKPPLVFVAATANRIEALPAELIRKGRFDQVFFCDLPSEAERREVFEIHIRDNQADPAELDLDRLVAETEDWNAAEIEQAVIAGRIEAAREGRPLSTADILVQTRTLVPLSRTMHEQIKFIRDWAWDRATPASGGQTIPLDAV